MWLPVRARGGATMRTVLLESNAEITALVTAGCAYLGIDLVATVDRTTLEVPSIRRAATDLLILDCSRRCPEDLAGLRHTMALPDAEVLVLGGVAPPVALMGQPHMEWLPAALGFPALLEWLRGARARATTKRGGWPRHPLSDQQWRIARLVARGMTQREIAAAEGVHIGTVKVQVGRILDRWPLDSTAELRLAMRRLLAAGLAVPGGQPRTRSG